MLDKYIPLNTNFKKSCNENSNKNCNFIISRFKLMKFKLTVDLSYFPDRKVVSFTKDDDFKKEKKNHLVLIDI